MRVVRRPLPFIERLSERDVETITLLVIHATEEPQIDDARRLAEASADLVAAHFYIDRNGRVEEWVPITRTAHHVRGHNNCSIGVELVNLGRHPDHFSSRSRLPQEPFPEAQLEALESLIADLHRLCPDLRQFKAHSDLDEDMRPSTDDAAIMVRRRVDPGPMFPWGRVHTYFARTLEI